MDLRGFHFALMVVLGLGEMLVDVEMSLEDLLDGCDVKKLMIKKLQIELSKVCAK